MSKSESLKHYQDESKKCLEKISKNIRDNILTIGTIKQVNCKAKDLVGLRFLTSFLIDDYLTSYCLESMPWFDPEPHIRIPDSQNYFDSVIISNKSDTINKEIKKP